MHIARFRKTFRAKLSLNFRSFLVRILFLWKWVHFRSIFCRTLQTVSPLMELLWPLLFIYKKSFPSLLASACFVVRHFSFVEQIVLVVSPDNSFATTTSPILFFICLQMVACEYLKYDLAFDISEYVFFLHLDADSAS